MANGLPAFWSGLLSVPFLGTGLNLIYNPIAEIRTTGLVLETGEIQMMGYLVAGFGAFILVTGLYIQFISLRIPKLREGEDIIDQRHPTYQVAIAKFMIGLPLLGLAGHLLFNTKIAMVYPAVTLMVGIYFFSDGLRTYWVNTLTQFFVTNERVLSEYRFVALRRHEIPLDKVRAVTEQKSIMEALVGLGNVSVASAGGSREVELAVHHIRNASGFADVIRELI